MLYYQDSSETSKYLNTIADVSTRWNSSYLAWCRLLKLKGYIKGLLNYLELQSDSDSRKDAKRLRNIMITEDEWLLIYDLKEMLFYFAEATDYLGGSKYCTYSSINPTIAVIMMKVHPSSSPATNFNLDKAGNAFDESPELERNEDQSESQEKININAPVNTYGLFDLIKKNLYKALIHYFNPTSSGALLAALLDPRFKKLKFATQEQKKGAEDELHKKYDAIKLGQPNSLPSNPPQQRKKRSLFDAFTNQTVSENEVIEYLELEEIPFEKDPYAWWNERKEKFPIISQLARKILGIRAASTPSERLFSDAGNLLTVKRSRIKPELFDRVIFLKRNGHNFINIHPPANI